MPCRKYCRNGTNAWFSFWFIFSFANIKPRKRQKVISPGRGTFLGRAPYRHYNSTPSKKIFDRIIRSLDHAQNELQEGSFTEESQKLAESTNKARNAVQSSDFSMAIQPY